MSIVIKIENQPVGKGKRKTVTTVGLKRDEAKGLLDALNDQWDKHPAVKRLYIALKDAGVDDA